MTGPSLGVFALRNTPMPRRWQVAAKAGFAGISVSWPEIVQAREDGRPVATLAEDAAALDLRLTDLEYFSLLSGAPPAELRALVRDMADTAAELGCTKVTSVAKTATGFVTAPADGEPVPQLAVDNLGLLADACAEAGISAVVEFMPQVTAVDTLARAVALLSAVGRSNAKLVVDAIHFFRAGPDWTGLSTLDPETVGCVQLCDATAVQSVESYLTESLDHRLLPGEGDLDLARFVDVTRGVAQPYTVEVLSAALRDQDPSVAAARMLAAALPLIEVTPSTLSG